MKIKEYYIYTDGGCLSSRNKNRDCSTGPGGCAFLILNERGNVLSSGARGFRSTDNVRMEMRGIIMAFSSYDILKDVPVYIYTDCAAITDSINNGHINKWINNNWYHHKGYKIRNIDLWRQLNVIRNNYKVTFNWVKAHVGAATRDNKPIGSAMKSHNHYNDFCDDMVRQIYRGVAENLLHIDDRSEVYKLKR